MFRGIEMSGLYLCFLLLFCTKLLGGVFCGEFRKDMKLIITKEFYFYIVSLLVILTLSPPDGITAMEPWPGQAPECLESSCRGSNPAAGFWSSSSLMLKFFPTHVFYTPSLHRSKHSVPYPKRRRNIVAVLGLEPSSILKLGPILMQNHKMPAPTRPGAG